MPLAKYQLNTQYNNPSWDWVLVSTSEDLDDIMYWSRRKTLASWRLSLRERPYLLVFNDVVDYTKFKGSFLYIFRPLTTNIGRKVTIACFPHPHERQSAYDMFKNNAVAMCNGTIIDNDRNVKIGMKVIRRTAAE